MQNLLDLPIPVLGAAAAALLVVAIAMLSRLKWALVVIGALFFLSSISIAHYYWGGEVRLWLYPLQANRTVIYWVVASLLFLSIIGHLSSMRFFSLPRQAVILLMIAAYAALLRAVHESPQDGAATFAFMLTTMLPLVVVLPALLQRWDDWVHLLRALALANVVWTGCVGIQFLNRGLLTIDRSARFVGLTGNPQHAGTLIAVTTTIALWLFMNDNRRFRPFWLALIGANVIMLGWSGSRTGMGMMTIGLAAVLYGRVGRAILYLPLLALVVLGALPLTVISGIDLGLERLVMTKNTRAAGWALLLDNALKNPLFGAGVTEAGDTENSYLFAFASFGIFMVGLFALLMIVSAQLMLRLIGLRRQLGPRARSLIDLVIGYNAMYFAGGMFEGYMLARVAANHTMILVMSAVASRLLVKTTSERDWAEDVAFENETRLDDEELSEAFDEGADETEAYGDYEYDDFGEYGDYGDYGESLEPT